MYVCLICTTTPNMSRLEKITKTQNLELGWWLGIDTATDSVMRWGISGAFVYREIIIGDGDCLGAIFLDSIWYTHAATARQLCCEQVLFLVASVCASIHRKSRKLLLKNWCNLTGIWIIVNARSDWKLMTFDLDLWPWELFSYFFSSGYTFTMAWPSNFVFGVRIHLYNI